MVKNLSDPYLLTTHLYVWVYLGGEGGYTSMYNLGSLTQAHGGQCSVVCNLVRLQFLKREVRGIQVYGVLAHGQGGHHISVCSMYIIDTKKYSWGCSVSTAQQNLKL